VLQTPAGFVVPSLKDGSKYDALECREHDIKMITCACKACRVLKRGLCAKKLAIILSTFNGPDLGPVLAFYHKSQKHEDVNVDDDSFNRLARAKGNTPKTRAAGIGKKTGPGPDSTRNQQAKNTVPGKQTTPSDTILLSKLRKKAVKAGNKLSQLTENFSVCGSRSSAGQFSSRFQANVVEKELS
jgi:hypothetical protein